MPPSSAILLTTLVIATIQTRALDCPTPAVMANFDTDKFLGTWYEIESTPNVLEFGGRCVKYIYKSQEQFVVNVDLEMDKPRDGGSSAISGMLTPEIKNSTLAKFNLAFLLPEEPAKPGIYYISYWILGTDYTSYAVAWSCKTEQVSGIELPKYTVWILGRTETMDSYAYANADKVLKRVADYTPRYDLKETIPCSGASMATVSFLSILITLIFGRTLVLL